MGSRRRHNVDSILNVDSIVGSRKRTLFIVWFTHTYLYVLWFDNDQDVCVCVFDGDPSLLFENKTTGFYLGYDEESRILGEETRN